MMLTDVNILIYFTDCFLSKTTNKKKNKERTKLREKRVINCKNLK